ncbi:amidohydrolase family protein [Caenimonas soli]|uniref:amidohydrolase family protein n=1 Tax=Caenimonas soli TaxID=2735555 RepID=UPI001554CF2B|nr:amidohydrolase family protein [Caenimonas soli]NPC54854.1 amidohydrolase [Caenimonas soli]
MTFIDFSSRPPVPELTLPPTEHLKNYRRVYASSEALVDKELGPEALQDYLATYERLGAEAVVLKARDLTSTFGVKIPNEAVAAFCKSHGDRFIGFAGVDPHRGMAAVRELEHAVRELGLCGLNIQGFEHKLPINDKLLYPLYAKCVELDIPVNIHCGMNFSTATAATFGHPAALDEVLMHFPELRVCASPPGWPWVSELLAVAWRHPNLWIGIVAMRPKLLALPNSGYEALLQYGKTILKGRMIFGSGYPMMPVERSLQELHDLQLPGDIQDLWLKGNAKNFLRR